MASGSIDIGTEITGSKVNFHSIERICRGLCAMGWGTGIHKLNANHVSHPALQENELSQFVLEWRPETVHVLNVICVKRESIDPECTKLVTESPKQTHKTVAKTIP